MIRFIGVVGPKAGSASLRRDLDRVAEHRHLLRIASGKQFELLASDSPPNCSRHDSANFLIGDAFDRWSSTTIDRQIRVLNNEDLEALHGLKSSGRYWGSYISIRIESDGSSFEAYRSPFATISFYFAMVAGVTIFASDAALIRDLAAIPIQVDWSMVTRALLFPDIREPATALSPISELMCGSRISLSDNNVALHQTWSPWDHVGQSAERYSEASVGNALHGQIQRCVRSWASLYDQPLFELSGGLDSSVIVASAQGGSPLSTITYVSMGAHGDERRYAAAVCEELGARFSPVDVAADAISLESSAAASLPRPSARSFTQCTDGAISALAMDRKADAFFGGGGGDNVFCFLHSSAPVADRWIAEGLSFELLETFVDVASMCGCTAWQVGISAIRARARRRRPRSWPINCELLASPLKNGQHAAPAHPWLLPNGAASPGKQQHVAALIRACHQLDGFSRIPGVPIVYPLLSQPLVELCLSMPSWWWVSGGRNRSIVRDAFRGELPDLIIERRTKGGFDGLITEFFLRNRQQIISMLLDGLLARHNIIDIDALYSINNREPELRSMWHYRVLALLDVEIWARSWTAGAPARSAFKPAQ